MNRINPLLNLGKKFVPQMVDGVWHSPAISARKKAELFKEWKYFGTIYGVQAQWDPTWNTIPKPIIMKPPKGHKFDNERSQRADEIVKKLEEMPKLIQEYRDKYHEAHKKVSLLEKYGLKDIYTESEKKENRSKSKKKNLSAGKRSQTKAAKAIGKTDKNAKASSKKAAPTAKKPAAPAKAAPKKK